MSSPLASTPTKTPLRWIDILSLAVEGRGWADTEHPFDRLPSRAKSFVSDLVWNLSHDSAGMLVHFASDTSELRVHGTLRKSQLAMSHMPVTGVSGLDLYVRMDGGWRWMASLRPESTTEISGTLFERLPAERREFLLYLPLYNGVEALRLGVAESCRCDPVLRSEKPIVFYGTSIIQGGCASRPGMAHVSMLRRRLDWPTVNLGFSGQGKAEPEMAELVAEQDPCLFVVDCLPNLLQDQVERVERFVQILRKRRPTTPIVLVESLEYPGGMAVPTLKVRHEKSNEMLRAIHRRLAHDDPHLHLVPAADLVGSDGEGTVDGVHPTDLGFIRMADRMEPLLRRLLPRATQDPAKILPLSS
jgi:lysophospholipase L1-like esterase